MRISQPDNFCVPLLPLQWSSFRGRSARLAAALLLLGSAQVFASTLNTYTSLGDAGQIPSEVQQDSFYCSDQIFVVIELEKFEPGAHQLHAMWYSPSGELSQSTHYDFQVVAEQERVWAWLKLHRETGAALIRMLDSSAGMETHIGSWRVVVEIDQSITTEVGFQVLC